MKHLRAYLLLLLPLLFTVLVALAVGWIGRVAYMIGMAILALGLTAGALTGMAALAGRGEVGTSAKLVAVVAVVLGWAGLQWMDDVHFQAAFRQDFAAARFADSGAPADDSFTEDDIAFFGEGAEYDLSLQVIDRVGFGGFAGRWLFRADAGVRLVGPWQNGRGLAVGRAGAVVWSVAEILLSVALAWLVLGRIRRRSEAVQAM